MQMFAVFSFFKCTLEEGCRMQLKRCADDLVILAESENELQDSLQASVLGGRIIL